jgi:hypothetical protein
LIDLALDQLRKLPVGQAPKIEQTKRIRVRALPHGGDAVSSSHGDADLGDATDGLSQLQITNRPEIPKGTPEIFVSYAWSDDSSEDARKRAEIVDRLCETIRQHGWNILRDSDVLRPGELILGFMKTNRARRSCDRGLERQIPALALLHDRVAFHLPAISGRKRGLLATDRSVDVR